MRPVCVVFSRGECGDPSPWLRTAELTVVLLPLGVVTSESYEARPCGVVVTPKPEEILIRRVALVPHILCASPRIPTQPHRESIVASRSCGAGHCQG